MEAGRSLLTYKGPVQPSRWKLREERETIVADGETMLYVLERLGFSVWFRYQKFREEFGARDATIALDETPIGTFVEIEGSRSRHHRGDAALGRSEPTSSSIPTAASTSTTARRTVSRRDMVFEE